MSLATKLDIARRFVALGFSVIPLKPRDKRPDGDVLPGGSWAPFQERHATTQELEGWFSGDRGELRNIGIVTGQISGVVVVDSDSPEAEAWAVEHLPGTPMMCLTAKGCHRTYRHPGDGEIRNAVRIRSGGDRLALDVKADGGYVVAPGSTHNSGHVYRAPQKWPDTLDALPAFDRAWLPTETRAPRLEAAVVVPSSLFADRSKLVSRARSYVKAIDPAIEGNGGNQQTFRVCCSLKRDFGLTDAEAFDVLADWNARCSPPWTHEELAKILRNAEQYGRHPVGELAAQNVSVSTHLRRTPDPDSDGADDAPPCGQRSSDDEKQKRGPTQPTRIVELVCESGADLWASKPGEPYISIAVGEHREHYPLKSSTAKDYVSRIYYVDTGKAPNASSLADALCTLSGKARFDGEPRDVYVRVANVDDRIYLDLGDPSWRAVEICAEGWRVVTVPPISFRRPRGLLPLPEPQRGGSLQELRPFLNIASDDDFILMVVWVLAAMRGVGPYPIKTFMAEQGAAKTTTTRALRRLFDPNESDVRRPPRNTEDLMIAASNGHVVAFDNLSTLSSELSDNLAVLSTGGGFAVRKLYENTEEVIFNAQKPIILNGISQVATRGDLLSRAIVVTLPPIPEDRRKDEATFWREYEQAHPRILGALLDAVVVGLQRVQHVRLERKPRMADFAIWGVAVEPACPWPAGRFLDVYADNRQGAVEAMLEGDPVADAVRIMAPWKGTSGEFLQKLNEVVPGHITSRKDWFTRSRAATDALRRLGPALRRIGIDVKEPEKDIKRQADGRFYVIEKTVSATSCPSSTSSDPHSRAVVNDTPFDGLRFASSPASSKNSNKNGANDAHDAHDTQNTCSQDATWLDLK